MSYQDELREQARKRARRNYINKMVMLVIFLAVVLFIIHFLGKESDKLTNNKRAKTNDTIQVESTPNVNETE